MTANVTTNYEYVGDGNPAGTIIGRASSELIGFYGTTPAAQPSTITTVDTTTITTVQTATITTAIATTNTTWAGVAEADLRLHALAINRLVADSQLQAETVNTLVSRLQTLGLVASS